MPGLRLSSVLGLIAGGLLALSSSALAQTRPMGTDVSSYQGASLNWTTLRNDGISFAWAKCAEGTATDGYIGQDADFLVNEAHAKAAGVLIGAYYFAHPEVDIGTAGADAEAAYFWGIAGPYITNGGSYLMPMLDVETSYSNTTYMSQWVNQWCNDVSNYAAAKGVTIRPVLYTSPSFVTHYNSTVTQWIPWIAQYPFCTTTNGQTLCGSPTPQASVPESSGPWPTWAIWQYGDTNWSGGDSDVFNGTTNQFVQLFVIGASNPPANSTYSWDPSGTKASPGSGGSGTWNNTTPNWWYSGAADTFWPLLGENATFAGTSGTVTLSGNQVTSSLTFSTSGYTIAGSATLLLGSPGTINIPTNNTATISAVFGEGAFNLTGGGKLILNNNGNYTAGEKITGPNTTLEVPTDHPTGNDGVTMTLASGGIYQDDDATSGDQFMLTGCNLVLSSGGGILKNPNGNLSMTNPISGAGSLTLAGTSFTLTLTYTANSYTGGTIVQSGTLKANAAGVLGSTSGALTVSGGTLNLNSATHTVGAVTISGGTITTGTLMANSYAGQSGSVSAVLAGAGSMTKSTTNTLTLSAADTYTGTTIINAGTLALSASGSIAKTSRLSIAAGGTFDVSTIANYNWPSNTTLLANGTSNVATLKGGTTINLDSCPLNLTYDGSHPTLTVSQGSLSLNGNSFLINGTALGVGNYTIIQQTSGSISAAGTLTVSGTAIGAGRIGSLSVSGGNVVLTITDTTTTALNSLSPTPYGQPVTFTATIAPTPTGGSVQFYDNAVALGGPVPLSGATASYTTNILAVGSHPITANYSGTTFYAASSTASASTQGITLPPNTIPANITGLNLLGNGSVSLNFTGTPGYIYLIQATTNLNPVQWTTIGTNAADSSGNFSFIDTNATSFSSRFYQTTTQQ